MRKLGKKKLGILGGSFDPPHVGHLKISLEAKKRFKLNTVIWAVTNKNPFKNKCENSLKEIHSIVTSKKSKLDIQEARELVKRSIKFKNERGRLPSLSASDPWERRMAEGIAFLQQKEREKSNE